MDQFFRVFALLIAMERVSGSAELPSALLLSALSAGTTSGKEVRKKLQEDYGLHFASAEFLQWLSALEKKKMIAQKGGTHSIQLLAAGRERKRQIAAEAEGVLEEIGKLLMTLKSKLHFPGSLAILAEKLDGVLCGHLPTLSPEGSRLDAPKRVLDDLDEQIIRFMITARRDDPAAYTLLKEIAAVIVSYNLLKNGGMLQPGRAFSKTTVYLDANMILSLFGLHEEMINLPAWELFQELKQRPEFTVKVLEYTVEEVRSILAGYRKHSAEYFPEFEVSSVYYALKARAVSPDDLEHDFLSKLEQKIEEELGIPIEYFPMELNEQNLEESKIHELTARKKPFPSPADPHFFAQDLDVSARHDLFAIRHIRELRGNKAKKQIEESAAIFLTADHILTAFNRREFRHLHAGTIPEVIHYGFLLSTLWCNAPEAASEFPLFAIIIEAYQRVRINIKVWESFLTEFRELMERGEYTSEQVQTLLSSPALEANLRRVTPAQVTPAFFEKMYHRAQAERQKTIKKLAVEIREKIQEEMTEQHTNDFQGKGEARMKHLAHKLSVYSIQLLALVGIFAISYLCYFGAAILQTEWTHLEADITIISFWLLVAGFFLHFALGIKIHPLKIRQKIYEYFFGKFYRFILRHFAI